MAHTNPVKPNIPLLASGLVSAAAGVAIPVFVLDWGHPQGSFAIAAVFMVLLIIYGVVGTLLGLATLVPGISR